MARVRDTQRKKVYDAEEVLRPSAKALPKVGDIALFAGLLLQRQRLRSDVLEIANRPYKMQQAQEDMLFRVPLVKDGRGRSRACGSSRAISMPKWSRNDWIVCHELAHSLVPRLWGTLTVAAHGKEFCGVFLLLVKHSMGQEAYAALRRSFAQANVSFLA